MTEILLSLARGVRFRPSDTGCVVASMWPCTDAGAASTTRPPSRCIGLDKIDVGRFELPLVTGNHGPCAATSLTNTTQLPVTDPGFSAMLILMIEHLERPSDVEPAKWTCVFAGPTLTLQSSSPKPLPFRDWPRLPDGRWSRAELAASPHLNGDDG